MLDIKEIEAKLIGLSFIEKVYYFDEIESTNNFAKTLTGENNVLVLTDYQSAGRGRLERNWISERDSNLTFTIKKQFDVDSRKIQSVNFFTSYMLFASIDKYLSSQMPVGNYSLTIKWPNDILLNGKKLCGILIESILPKNVFIIGAGININQESFPDEMSNNVSSFKNFLGHQTNCSEFLIEIMRLFNANIYLLQNRNYSKIFKLWKDNNRFIGKNILFLTNGNVKRNAQILDFFEDGGIKLKIDSKEVVYYNGDIRILNVS